MMIVIIIAKPTERGEGAAAAAKTQRSPPSLSSPLLSIFCPMEWDRQAVAALQGKINVDKLDRFTCPHATHTIPQLGRRVGFSSTLD